MNDSCHIYFVFHCGADLKGGIVSFCERKRCPGQRVLQCVAVRCSALQCVAVCCSVLYCVVVCYSVLQCVTVCCNVLQCA